MSPTISTSRRRDKTALINRDATRKEAETRIKALRDKIIDGAEDVGRDFADEARKIHYGESEQRGIYGEANQEEVISLVDEGVEILPLPCFPDDTN